jgi:hypothetical protein
MTKPAAVAQATQNEPSQSAIDAVNLFRIKSAQDKHNTMTGELRGVFAKAQLQNLNTDAAKTALTLVKKGDSAIEDYFSEFRKVGDYVKLLGKELTPAQYELFGLKQGPTPEDERAGIEGLAAGRGFDVEEAANPYEIGSVKGQAWLSKFRIGRSERDAIMSMPEPEQKEKAEGQSEEGAGD